MAYQMVECNNCKKIGKSVYRGNVLITIILLICWIVPGIIYMIWRRGGIGVCNNCKSPNVVPYIAKKSKIIAQDAFNTSHIVPELATGEEEKVRCPDCREFILKGARKCKHCGTMFEAAI